MASAAIAGAGRIGNPGFNKSLYRVLAGNAADRSDQRAAAAWALARTGKPNASIVNRLKQICLEKIITVEGEKIPDSDFVRAAACFALIDLGKTDSAAASAATGVIKAVAGAEKDDDLAGETLKEIHPAGRSLPPERQGRTRTGSTLEAHSQTEQDAIKQTGETISFNSKKE